MDLFRDVCRLSFTDEFHAPDGWRRMEEDVPPGPNKEVVEIWLGWNQT